MTKSILETIKDKQINSASVYFAGERAAGIRSAHFNLEVWIDLGAIDKKEQLQYLTEVRSSIAKTYELMLGQKPTFVLFDFEYEGA